MSPSLSYLKKTILFMFLTMNLRFFLCVKISNHVFFKNLIISNCSRLIFSISCFPY